MGGYVSTEREGWRGANGRGRRQRGRPSSETESGEDDWAAEPVEALPAEDFDFDANLARFDKAGVFESIRNEDATQPEERLVYANKLRDERGVPKLGIRENVLDGLTLVNRDEVETGVYGV